jgi:hypothetical protein
MLFVPLVPRRAVCEDSAVLLPLDPLSLPDLTRAVDSRVVSLPAVGVAALALDVRVALVLAAMEVGASVPTVRFDFARLLEDLAADMGDPLDADVDGDDSLTARTRIVPVFNDS